MTSIRACRGKIIVTDMKKGERKVGSIILRNDDGKEHGIRPRWAKVYAVGSDITEIEPGQWVLVEHGRWSRPFNVSVSADSEPTEFFEIERKSMMMVSDEEPDDNQVMATRTYGPPPV